MALVPQHVELISDRRITEGFSSRVDDRDTLGVGRYLRHARLASGPAPNHYWRLRRRAERRARTRTQRVIRELVAEMVARGE